MIRRKDNLIYSELTDKIIKCAYDVYNILGHGFLEKVYENALMINLRKMGISAIQQSPVKVHFEGELVGDFVADIFVEGKVIVEIKAVSALTNSHEVQLVNYLKATDVKVGLLINFGEKIKIVRRVF